MLIIAIVVLVLVALAGAAIALGRHHDDGDERGDLGPDRSPDE
jgi:hypothetical protein